MGVVILIGSLAMVSLGANESMTLKAAKDNYARSNKQIRNNGASTTLGIAAAAHIRTLIAFDLSSITNQVLSAELQFRPAASVSEKIDFTVAPMVNTTNNTAWGEGKGFLGTSGQNAQKGESCYIRSAFRDTPWESATGKPLTNLSDPKLWGTPIAQLTQQYWEEGKWITIPIRDLALLKKIQTSTTPIFTLGIWGTEGNGLYFINSKESQWAPILKLTLKKEAAQK
jgi:hypothetical protein